jgi:hypothetical protein
MILTLFSQVAINESMVAFGVRWLGPVVALGCGGFLLILVVLVVAVAVSAKRKE